MRAYNKVRQVPRFIKEKTKKLKSHVYDADEYEKFEWVK